MNNRRIELDVWIKPECITIWEKVNNQNIYIYNAVVLDEVNNKYNTDSRNYINKSLS